MKRADIDPDRFGIDGFHVGPADPVLAEARFRTPGPLPGQVERTELAARLGAPAGARIRVLSAPAGYGKTATLAEFARAAGRPVGWLTVDPALDRADLLVRYLAAALARLTIVDRAELLDDFLPPGALDSWLARLTNSLAVAGEPFALVVDDAHLVRSADARRVLEAVCRSVPAGSAVLLATRGAAPIPIAALRLAGEVDELGPDDLAFDLPSAVRLFERSGVRLATEAVELLVERTEGWPAGLGLALQAISAAPEPGAAARAWSLGDHRAADYFEEKVLAGLELGRRGFLVEVSVLGRFSRGLVRAAIGVEANELVGQSWRDGHFLVALDERHEWFRFSHPVAELLGQEARRTLDPQRIKLIHRRAALAEEANGDYASAVRHAAAADDDDLLAVVLERGAFRLEGQSGSASVLEAIGRLAPRRVETEPHLAIAAALIAAFAGSAAEARRYLFVAESAAAGRVGLREAGRLDARILVVRGLLGLAGISAMTALAIEAAELDPGDGPWRGLIELMRGVSQALLGQPDMAMARLDQAARALLDEAPVAATFTLGYLALTALAAGQPEAADAAARLALDQAALLPALDRAGASAAAAAAAGEIAARRGQSAVALNRLLAASAAVERSAALPWWLIQLRTELGRLAVSLGELRLAATLVPAARRELLHFRDAGILPQALVQTEHALDLARRGQQVLREPLTPAEWHVLDLLQTHLPIPEIADRLFVSRNTTKSHVKALYEKLDAHSRSEAIERAVALKLLQAPPTS